MTTVHPATFKLRGRTQQEMKAFAMIRDERFPIDPDDEAAYLRRQCFESVQEQLIAAAAAWNDEDYLTALDKLDGVVSQLERIEDL